MAEVELRVYSHVKTLAAMVNGIEISEQFPEGSVVRAF